MTVTFRPQGTCSQEMHVQLSEDNVIEKLEVLGGCSGNLQGIAALVQGMPAKAVSYTHLDVYKRQAIRLH